MSEFTWKNLIAYRTFKCKICDETIGDNISTHMREKHKGIRSIEIFNGGAYSHSFEYPNILSS